MYDDHKNTLISPARGALAISPDDQKALLQESRALYVAKGGVVEVEMSDGMYVKFEGVPSGSILPCRVKRLRSGTTASGVVALW